MRQTRWFRFELFVLEGLLGFLLLFPGVASGQDLTVEAHKERVSAILKNLREWGIVAEARYGCDIGPNPYAANERYLVVLELIDHYVQLGDKRQANLWRRHIGWFYEHGLRDCGVLSPEEAGAGGGPRLMLAHTFYEDGGDIEGALRVLAAIRGSAVAANGKTPPTMYRGMSDE